MKAHVKTQQCCSPGGKKKKKKREGTRVDSPLSYEPSKYELGRDPMNANGGVDTTTTTTTWPPRQKGATIIISDCPRALASLTCWSPNRMGKNARVRAAGFLLFNAKQSRRLFAFLGFATARAGGSNLAEGHATFYSQASERARVCINQMLPVVLRRTILEHEVASAPLFASSLVTSPTR